jgi:hypothetical protein
MGATPRPNQVIEDDRGRSGGLRETEVNPSPAEIRTARPADALALAEVHVRSWQAGYRHLLPDAYLDSLRPADRAARYTFDRHGTNDPDTIVVLVGGVIRASRLSRPVEIWSTFAG